MTVAGAKSRIRSHCCFFEEWCERLLGFAKPAIVFSIHANLRYFMTAQELTARQAIWVSFSSEFYLNVVHIAGKKNPANPASRRANFSQGASSMDRVTLLGQREVIHSHATISNVSLSQMKNSDITGRADFFFDLNASRSFNYVGFAWFVQ